MNEILISILLIIGCLFMLVGAIGILRMPDMFMRLSATTKAATLGIALVLGASAIFFGNIEITSKIIATIIFVFLTAPISAHMIGRAAYFNRIGLWKNTVIDELHGHYDFSTHELDSKIESEEDA